LACDGYHQNSLCNLRLLGGDFHCDPPRTSWLTIFENSVRFTGIGGSSELILADDKTD